MNELSSDKESIEKVERLLRDTIDYEMSNKFGPKWVEDEYLEGEEDLEKFNNKIKHDQGIQKNLSVVYRPIEYLEFLDLINIINEYEDLFKPVFKDWDRYMVFLDICNKFRNPKKHHRDLTPTQYHLLTGIAGEIEDAINIWRIGSKLELKKTHFEFAILVDRNNKTNEQIIEESKTIINNMSNKILDAVQKAGLTNLNKQEKTDFNFVARLGGHEFRVFTNPDAAKTSSPNYKQINMTVVWSQSARGNIDIILKTLDIPYRAIKYELVDSINVEKLKLWSEEVGGLNPGGKGLSIGELTHIDYQLIKDKLYIAVEKYSDFNNQKGGVILASANYDNAFWAFHKLIRPEHLIGYMVGTIMPRSIVYLIKQSQQKSNL